MAAATFYVNARSTREAYEIASSRYPNATVDASRIVRGKGIRGRTGYARYTVELEIELEITDRKENDR